MKKMKRILCLALAVLMLLGLAACTGKKPGGQADDKPTKPKHQGPVLLVVSFGTTHKDSRDADIGALEKMLHEYFPSYEVRRAFTSQNVINKVKKQEGIKIDNVHEAMERMVADGVKKVVVQPTHVMAGNEYEDVIREVSKYADKFESLAVGLPLLADDKDYDTLIDALRQETRQYDGDDTAIVFMGHGTEHPSNSVYGRLQKRFHAAGYRNYFVGTAEAVPSLKDTIAAVKKSGAKKVVLLPLMVAAGDHAKNDMAGDAPGSWKTEFEKAGFEVECVLEGMGRYKTVQKMYVDCVDYALAGKKPVVLAVSFGTSHRDTREKTIGAVEKDLQLAFPGYEVRRAFTSQNIIDILDKRDGYMIDNVSQALDRILADGIREVIVQPTHVLEGFEYDTVKQELARYADKFDSLSLGRGLIVSEQDYQSVITALVTETQQYDEEGTAIVFMGHGTGHEANAVYQNLQDKLNTNGFTNYFIGTVEATPSLEDVIAAVKKTDAKKVVLLPLMIVAGEYAKNDMAGSEAGSWKTEFQKAGYEVQCVLKGLGEYQDIRDMIVIHANKAEPVESIPKDDTPQKGTLQDGTYEIHVDSSSSMFKVSTCELTVRNGQMTAVITMSGHGYGKIFMGTAEEALTADESAFILDVPNAEGCNTFQMSVKALDEEIALAAWSENKQTWYDRTLVFRSDAIPREAFQ